MFIWDKMYVSDFAGKTEWRRRINNAGLESKGDKSIWPPPLDGTVVVLQTLNIMIMTFCSYAGILEELFLTLDAHT